MSGGLVALSGMQRGIETTSGTAVAATAIQPILGGWLHEIVERQFPEEQRYSLIAAYRNFAVKNFVELQGITIAPTFTDLAWWGSLFWKGLATGSPRKPAGSGPTNTSVYTYTHTPTIASDDLNTATLEVGDDVQNFQVPFVLGDNIALTWAPNAGLTCSMDLLGQRAIPQSKTAALSVVGDEDINGALATITVDTSTIGSTSLNTLIEANVRWANAWSHEFVLDGNLYPRGAHRSRVKQVMIDATFLFSSSTEYTSIYENSGIGTPRKIRISNAGTTIASSSPSTARNLQVDVYCVWQDAQFDTINGQRACKFSGMAQYDSSATHDQQVVIRNALATIS